VRINPRAAICNDGEAFAKIEPYFSIVDQRDPIGGVVTRFRNTGCIREGMSIMNNLRNSGETLNVSAV